MHMVEKFDDEDAKNSNFSNQMRFRKKSSDGDYDFTLLVYNVGQYRLRQQLKKEKDTLPNQLGKQTRYSWKQH